MTPPLLKVSGPSNSGKTKLVEELIPLFQQQDNRVGVLKHDPHDHWEWDQPGTDTARFAESGADCVAILSDQRHGIYQDHDGSLDATSLIESFQPTPDVIILEGFKSREFPGFEFVNGTWTDHAGNQYRTGEIEKIKQRSLEIIRQQYKSNHADCILTVDGEAVPLKAFPKSALIEVLEGYVRSLDGVEPGGELTVHIRHH